jgi:hypothetical protein
MTLRVSTALYLLIFPLTILAEPTYCPQKSGFIDIGMTQEQVLSACGEPLSKQQLKTPAMQQVPVKQLIYTTLNQGTVYPGLDAAFYEQWSLPSGSSGTSLQFNIVNEKVKGVTINGSSTNVMTICEGQSVAVGDDESKVYTACGDPSMVNNTYVNVPIANAGKPMVWIYQFNPYQAPITLTFVNGKLQSMD